MYYLNSEENGQPSIEFWDGKKFKWSRKKDDLTENNLGAGIFLQNTVLRKSYTDSNKIVCSIVLTDRQIWSWNAKEYFEIYKEEYQKGKLDQRIQAYKEYFLVQWTYAWGKQLKIALNRETGEIRSIFDVQFYFYELTEDYYISSSAKGKVPI